MGIKRIISNYFLNKQFNKKTCHTNGSEHDLRLEIHKYLKDKQVCTKCDYKEKVTYKTHYKHYQYEMMLKNYVNFENNTELADYIKDRVKISSKENEPLFRNLIDLMDVVGLEKLLENPIRYDTNNFNNDLNDFLKFYVNYFASFVANESDDE